MKYSELKDLDSNNKSTLQSILVCNITNVINIATYYY